MERWIKPGIFWIGLLLFCGSLSAQPAQAKVDNAKILGTWQVDIDADGTYYRLTMNLQQTAGKLEGTLTESQGMFKDLPMAEVVFDGEKLAFKFNSATPPDGVTREVDAEFKLVEGVLDGLVRVPELSVSVPAKGTREAPQKS